jgi:hypothetical protein
MSTAVAPGGHELDGDGARATSSAVTQNRTTDDAAA